MPPRVTPEYNPVPTVAPNQVRDPSEHVHINFPNVRISQGVGQALAEVGRQGFGTLSQATRGVAEAYDQLGTQLERTGEKLWDRAVGLQTLKLETDVKKRELEYETWLNDKNLKYSQLQGEGASEETLQAHMKEVEEKRNLMGKGLPPVGQRMWDRATQGAMISSIKGAAQHAATETKRAALGASDARVDMKTDAFSKEDDIGRSQQLYKEAEQEFWSTKVPLSGWTRDQAQAEWQKQVSKMYGSKITRYADQDAVRALKMLEENKDLIDANTYTRVYETTMSKFREQYGGNVAREIQEKMPDADYEKKRDAAEKRADEVLKQLKIEDPMFKKKVDDRMTVEHDRYNKEQREQYAKHQYNAKDAAFGYQAPGGKKPTTKEEFDAIPGAREAYDSLKPGDKHIIDQILLSNMKEDYPRTPATRERVNELLGEAYSNDPNARDEFMLRNFYNEKIPGEDRDKLFALQRKMRADIYKEDPHLTKGWRVISDQLPTTMTGANRNSTARKQFDGAFYNAIMSKVAEKKGVPLTTDEYREVAQQLLREMPGTGWFGSDYGKQKLYQTIRPSSEDMRQMKDANPHLTEQQLIDAYIRHKYKEYSGKYEKLKDLGPTKPAAPAARSGRRTPGAPEVPQSQ